MSLSQEHVSDYRRWDSYCSEYRYILQYMSRNFINTVAYVSNLSTTVPTKIVSVLIPDCSRVSKADIFHLRLTLFAVDTFWQL
jgi:hypothetical protein